MSSCRHRLLAWFVSLTMFVTLLVPAGASASGTTLLQKVKTSHTLTVALAPFAPLEFQNPKTKAWEGFDIQMLSRFASTLGARLVVQDMPFAATIEAVSTRRDDVTANIFKTAARAKVISFSRPVLNYLDGVIVNSVKPQVTKDTVAGLRGKSIGTCRGCAEEAFVPKVPGATDVSYATADDSFLAVATNRVAAAFQPVMYAQYALQVTPSLHIKVLGAIPKAIAGKAQAPRGFYGVAKGAYSRSFLSKLNSFIVKECRSGGTAQILKGYGLTSPSYVKGLCPAPAHNDLLAQVRHSGELTVALAPFAPLEFQNPKTKAWEGFDIQMLSTFAHRLGVKLVVQDMPFAATIEAVSTHRDDITANIFKTPARSKVIRFSRPVLNYLDGVIVNSVKPQVTKDTVAGLRGKSIGTCRGCAEEALVPKVPGATDVSYATADDSFLAVATNRVAAAFQPVMYAQYALQVTPSLHIKVLGAIPKAIAGKAQAPRGFYGLPRGSYSQRLLLRLNHFIVQQCRSGATARILAHYGLTSPSYVKGLC